MPQRRDDSDAAARNIAGRSAWTDLERPPLSVRRLAAAVVDGGLWRDVRVVEVTRSTNADVAAAAQDGAPEGFVLIAERQDGGRGRLDRTWESPARAGILMSMLLRPVVPASTLPLLPLLVGVGVVEAVRAVADLDARLKWPNDVLVGGRKLGGILVERSDAAVVAGVGLNVSTRPEELPVDTATSVAIEGGHADREPLVKEVLRAVGRRYAVYAEADGSPESVLPAYREVCETIGSVVVVHAPGGEQMHGRAVAVDDTGMLVVRAVDGSERRWSAGDVVHVRAEG